MERFTIAGGNTTLLIENCPNPQTRVALAKKNIDAYNAEQVGFINSSASQPSLEMMGGELCINATLAFAKKLDGQGVLKASGLPNPVKYYQVANKTFARFSLSYQVLDDRFGKIILFEGIGYLVTDKLKVPQEYLVRDLCDKFDLPAFGLAISRGDTLEPYVYVGETDTLVSETSCGSGSIAVAIATGQRFITQRTGQRISVQRIGENDFTVGAKVAKIKG